MSEVLFDTTWFKVFNIPPYGEVIATLEYNKNSAHKKKYSVKISWKPENKPVKSSYLLFAETLEEAEGKFEFFFDHDVEMFLEETA